MADGPGLSGLFYGVLQQGDAQGSKTSVMRTLTWIIASELAALGFVARSETPIVWLLIVLCVFLGFTIATGLFAFLWSLIKNPDLLRSERFAIRKLEIEQLGDSLVGLRNTRDEPLLPDTLGSHSTPRLVSATERLKPVEGKPKP